MIKFLKNLFKKKDPDKGLTREQLIEKYSANVAETKEYKKSRKNLDKYIKDLNSGEVLKTVSSDSNKYWLTIRSYKTREGSWNYTRGTVTDSLGNVITDVKRNYTRFPFLFLSHSNGKEYLVCGENYQGYTIVNLTDRTSKVYFPLAGLKGGGFCWSGYKYDKEQNHLIVDGCFWAAPYEIVTYDFSNPDKVPLKELSRKYEEYEEEDEEEDEEETSNICDTKILDVKGEV